MIEHRGEQMFGLDLLILILFGDANGTLYGLLTTDREFIKSHILKQTTQLVYMHNKI